MRDELVVDNFAGGGGASHGMERALGVQVDIAINHDPEAIAMHKANHPATKHFCESVWDIDPMTATHGRPVGVAWFSPDCKHFSKAKGGRPVNKHIRGLAWIVIKWAETVRPRVIVVENVEEFKTWGPLNGDMPDLERRGETFKAWIGKLRRLGYEVEHRELRACDYGAPTIRKRLFLIARCDGRPIVWPEMTHGEGRTPFRTAAECIDWSIHCPSIFDRKRPLVENTLRRIAKGIKRFVVDEPDPFISSVLTAPFITEHANSSSQRNMPINEPMRTQCAQVKGGHFALVAPYIVKHFGGATGAKATRPLPTITTRNTQNQLITTFLTRQFGQGIGRSLNEPAPTVTAGGMGKTGLVQLSLFDRKMRQDEEALFSSHLIKLRGTCQHGQDIRQPMPTVTAGGLHIGEVRAFLVKYYGTAIGQKISEPLHSATTKARFGLVTVAGEDYQIADIGMRMLTPRELFRAQGFPDTYIINPDFNGKPLTKTSQVRMCGNSVSPYNARAIIEANLN